jgi:RHS repeat-associated protein
MLSRIGGTFYRYGFNGKETHNEVKGFQNQQDYGMRIYDPRIGRFLSVDPISKSYPELTPYQFTSNSPIANIDMDGGEAKYFNTETIETYNSKGKLVQEDTRTTEDKSKEAGWFVHGALYRLKGSLGSGTLFSYYKAVHTYNEDGSITITIQDNGSVYIPSANDKGKGGLYFVSSSGTMTNSSGSLTGDDAIPINIDLLGAVVGGFPKGNSSRNMFSSEHSGGK